MYQFPDEILKARLSAAGIEADDLPDISKFSEVDGVVQTGTVLAYKVTSFLAQVCT